MSGGGGTTTQAQTQQSSTAPWAPAQPMLQSILGQLGTAPTGPNAGQVDATGRIVSEASGMPSYGAQGQNAVSNLFGSDTSAGQNMLTGAYGEAKGALSPMLAAGYTDPYTNPALRSAMGTLNNDITNQVNGQFAAAGRPAGTNADSAQALARGLAQGEGGLLANEFNTLTSNQMGAANQLTGAASSTAGGVNQLQQSQLGNQVAGIGAAGAIPGLITQPGQTQLQAANLQAGLPTANLQNLEGLTLPIAQLGTQSNGTMTGTTTPPTTPWYTNAMGAGFGGLGLLGGTGAFGNSGWMSGLGTMLSDERVKDDIKPVGMLYDGQKVYSYHYKGDDVPRIGLLAQEVEKHEPAAVHDFGGVKAVNYGVATERARQIGMLADMNMAA